MFSEIAKVRLKTLKETKAVRSSQRQRLNALKDIESGKFAEDFAKWVSDYARTEKDIKVSCEPWVNDWNKLNGDLRLSDVVVSGAAQIYKSLGSYLLNLYVNEVGNLNTLFTFAKSKIRDKMMSSTVSPIRGYNRAVLSNTPAIIDNNQLFKTNEFSAYYGFVNSQAIDGNSAVPAELASISVDVMILDEYSQYNSSVAATLRNRQANSELASRPVRYVSTPGRAGTGIDVELQRCSHIFESYVKCPHCGELASLSPLLALYNKTQITDCNGEEVMSHFDEQMRMLDWNFEDVNDKVNTAFLACHHCRGKLPEDINSMARFYDSKTMISVDDFISEVKEDPWRIRKVGIIASPFLRRTKSNIAARVVSDGLATENALDFIQQTLGIATTDSFNGLNIEILKPLILGSKQPTNLDAFTTATVVGLDVARSAHYYSVMNAYIPKQGTPETKYRDAIRSYVEFDKVSTGNIHALVKRTSPDVFGVDLNPDQSLSFSLHRQFKAVPFVQKDNLSDIFRVDKEIDGAGFTQQSVSINNQYFINSLMKSFRRVVDGEYVIRLPLNLEQEINNTTKTGVVGHLLNMTYNEEKDRWMKGNQNRSDYFYAMLFAELSLYYYVFERKDFSWLAFFK